MSGRDVAAGHRRDHHARHHVQRRVQAHQRIAARPVELERERLPELRPRHRGRGEVPHRVGGVALARIDDGDPLAVRAQQSTRVALLPAADRVEDRAVEFDAAIVHGDDPRVAVFA